MSNKTCECCGAMIGMEAAINKVPMGPVARRAFHFLARQNGRYVLTDRVVDHVYAEHPDGGPENARVSLHTTIHRVRPRLREVGLEYLSRPGRGGGCALRWAP